MNRGASAISKFLFAHVAPAANTVSRMKTRPKLSATSRRKRRAVTELFCAVDALVAAAKEAERAKRIIVNRLVAESNGKLMRGADPRLAHRETSRNA